MAVHGWGERNAVLKFFLETCLLPLSGSPAGSTGTGTTPASKELSVVYDSPRSEVGATGTKPSFGSPTKKDPGAWHTCLQTSLTLRIPHTYEYLGAKGDKAEGVSDSGLAAI
ncbi:hypothetical protein B0H16DRAFT_1477000 [Mycena metata]|uniref:Uncharacterized protein n=1 Tax=Mycena metata TaxID=1033252 RepID=A0AAD7HA12_9AGAR|nr:hypothetical protein B0H16DRAFT_1477000 [Mycena metata]